MTISTLVILTKVLKQTQNTKDFLTPVLLFSDFRNRYTKHANKYCSNKANVAHTTYEEAVEACRGSDDCSGISDTDCDDDKFYLCPVSTTLKSSSKGSCVYVKGKYLQHMFKPYYDFHIIAMDLELKWRFYIFKSLGGPHCPETHQYAYLYGDHCCKHSSAVSYTHLTLPTNREV